MERNENSWNTIWNTAVFGPERGEARAPVPPHGGGVDEAHQRVRQKRAQRGNREGRHLTQLLAPEHAEQRVGGVFLFEVFFSRRAGSGSFSRRRSREPRRRAGVAAGTRRGRQRAARGVAIVRSVFNVKIRSAFESRLRVLGFLAEKASRVLSFCSDADVAERGFVSAWSRFASRPSSTAGVIFARMGDMYSMRSRSRLRRASSSCRAPAVHSSDIGSVPSVPIASSRSVERVCPAPAPLVSAEGSSRDASSEPDRAPVSAARAAMREPRSGGSPARRTHASFAPRASFGDVVRHRRCRRFFLAPPTHPRVTERAPAPTAARASTCRRALAIGGGRRIEVDAAPGPGTRIANCSPRAIERNDRQKAIFCMFVRPKTHSS